MPSHSGSENKPDILLMCSNCPKRFKTKNLLQKHSKRHSEKVLEPSYPCSQCDKLFRTRGLTLAHEKYVHGEKKYKCNQCERLFSTKRDFQNHDCNHKSRKFEYSCKQCDYKTVNKSKLNTHMRNVHNENYFSYFCNICLKGFVRRSNLILHIKKLHPGDNCSNIYLENNDLVTISDMYKGSSPIKETKNMLRDENLGKASSETKMQNNVNENARLQSKGLGNIKIPEEIYGLDFKCDNSDTEKQEDGSTSIMVKYNDPSFIKETSEILEDYDSKLESENPVSCIKNAIDIKNSFNALLEQETIEDTKEETPIVSDKEKQMKKVKKNKMSFTCPECKQIFLYKPSLKVHQRIHTGEKPYQCDKCEKSFSHMSAYNSHKTTHTDERPFQCNICGKGTKIKQSYTNHMRLHQGDKRYKCDECEKQCTTKQKLEVHKRKHSGEKPFQCTICMKTFSKAHNLKIHSSLQNKNKIYTCKNKTYTCDLCSETFLNSKKWKLHKITHYSYKCTICKKLFEKELGLMVHNTVCLFLCLSGSRPAGLPLICLQCGKEFQKQNHLQKHIRRHAMAASESVFPCISCSKPFKSKELVKMHEKYVHGEKKLQCVKCLKWFHANRALTQHKCKPCVRPAGSPLICLQCGKEFQKQNHLQKHIKRHALAASESVFPCPSCFKPFKSKELVKMHEKYVHGEKKLQCVKCLRRFRTNRELRQHKCKTYL